MFGKKPKPNREDARREMVDSLRAAIDKAASHHVDRREISNILEALAENQRRAWAMTATAVNSLSAPRCARANRFSAAFADDVRLQKGISDYEW